MKKFTEIDRFRTVVKGVHRYSFDRGQALPKYNYTGTVKLHGTNAGVRRTPSGKIVPQSRNRILDVTCDNYGFAAFVDAQREVFIKMFELIGNQSDDITVYGEWCGRGIQDTVAIAQLDLHYVIFGLSINDEYVPLHISNQKEFAQKFNSAGIYNILQVPSYSVEVDFSEPDAAILEMNRLTDEVEECCPWGKFRGVEGIGEGIVWIPDAYPEVSDLWFKTKGGKHSGGNKVRGIKATKSVEEVNSINECMDLVLPEWRLKQGISYLKENYVPIEHRAIGEYLKWISQDILKEEIDTITENGLEWKDMHKPINRRARQYILDVINNDFSV